MTFVPANHSRKHVRARARQRMRDPRVRAVQHVKKQRTRDGYTTLSSLKCGVHINFEGILVIDLQAKERVRRCDFPVVVPTRASVCPRRGP